MKKLLFLFAVLTFVACKNEDKEFKDFPTCIQEKIENNDLSDEIKRVQTQTIDGVVHYWLNTEVMQVDGTESIVNDSCEELCTIGGLLPSDCPHDYDSDNWTIIWEE